MSAALANLAPTVVIRAARGSDGPALRRLAELDSRPVPAGELLIAESGARIADPFRRSAALLDLLEVHATRPARRERRRQLRLRPAAV